VFDKIENLRKEADLEKKKAVGALRREKVANAKKIMAELAKNEITKVKEELDAKLKLIDYASVRLARKLIALPLNESNSFTSQILQDIQQILSGGKMIEDTVAISGTHFKITVEQLTAIVGSYNANLPEIVEWMNKTCTRYGINSPLTYAYFLGQVIYETGGFVYLSEPGSGAQYEGSENLGNTTPGDGKKYKGRGLLLVTGKRSYQQFGILWGEPDLFIITPTLLEKPRYAVWSACEFWKSRGIVELSKQLDADGAVFELITKKVNGGLNGLDKRKKYFEAALKVLQ
jgi:putative chitinase